MWWESHQSDHMVKFTVVCKMPEQHVSPQRICTIRTVKGRAAYTVFKEMGGLSSA